MSLSALPARWRRAALALGAGTLLAASLTVSAEPDARRQAHGISTARANNGDTLVFFSAGQPPEPGGSWHHDVLLSRWRDGALTAPIPFIQRDEAQEPVSVAQSSNGNILVTFEDGWDANGSVTQRYGVYGPALAPVAPYPREVKRGGHSGQAAALGNRFVVVYSDEWVQGGGVNDLGSGYGIYATIFDERGRALQNLPLAHQRREWWPVLAAGQNHIMAIWQRFVPGQPHAELVGAAIDPRRGTVGPTIVLHPAVKHYTYHVTWLPRVARFLVVGSTGERGFARLLTADGRFVAGMECLPETVREAGVAAAPVETSTTHALAYTPAAAGGLLQLTATANTITWTGTLPDFQPHTWPTNGSLGLFTKQGEVDWLYMVENTVAHRQFDPASLQPAGGCPK